MPGSRKGIPNKRTQGVLSLLRKDFDLDPILELAATVRREVPVVHEGEPVLDQDGNPVMRPYLAPHEMISALSKLADKCYPNLKAVEVSAGEGLPTVVLNLRGVEEEPKKRGAKKPRE
jgi:hypothetical protein